MLVPCGCPAHPGGVTWGEGMGAALSCDCMMFVCTHDLDRYPPGTFLALPRPAVT